MAAADPRGGGRGADVDAAHRLSARSTLRTARNGGGADGADEGGRGWVGCGQLCHGDQPVRIYPSSSFGGSGHFGRRWRFGARRCQAQALSAHHHQKPQIKAHLAALLYSAQTIARIAAQARLIPTAHQIVGQHEAHKAAKMASSRMQNTKGSSAKPVVISATIRAGRSIPPPQPTPRPFHARNRTKP